MKPIDALDQLIQIFETYSALITDYIIAAEKHKDGTDHLHAFIQCNKSLNIKKPTAFDLTSDLGITYHGNY